MNAGARRPDDAVSWIPIAELPDLARALLGERRGSRDVVPAHVRDRLVALARQWAAHGFTAKTVGPWTDLDPPAAALLAAAGLTPATLQEQPADGGISLWQALTDGTLSAQEAVDRLQPPAAPTPAAPATPRVAPATFSHPPNGSERDATDLRSRSMPQRTPFQT